MKRILYFALITVSVIACKKGTEDPTVSLQSRKARLVGEWRVAELSETMLWTLESGVTGQYPVVSSGTSSLTFDGSTFSLASSETNLQGGFTSPIAKGPGSMTYSFDKDGHVLKTETYRLVSDEVRTPNGTTTIKENVVIERTVDHTGKWNFMYGIGNEVKNKERIAIHWDTRNSSYTRTVSSEIISSSSGVADTVLATSVQKENATESVKSNDVDEVWQFTRLASKEIKASVASVFASTVSTSLDSLRTTFSGDTTYYQFRGDRVIRTENIEGTFTLTPR